MDKEAITKELQRIQGTIPRSYLKGVVRERAIAPTIKKVAELALKEDIPEKKKEQIRDLLNGGLLDQVEIVENKSATKKINAWVEKKIDESIKAGTLPSREELNKYYENQKRNSA